jgi:hypothetical protein
VHIEVEKTQSPSEAALAAEGSPPQPALVWLAENAIGDELPLDLSAEHDHYLYGAPKRS